MPVRLVWPQGSCALLVSSLTWARTLVIACWISMPGWAMLARQRAGERAVGAGLAVERGLAGAGGKGDQRALARLHLGEASLHIDGARRLGRSDLCRERVIAAGVQEYQLDLGIAPWSVPASGRR